MGRASAQISPHTRRETRHMFSDSCDSFRFWDKVLSWQASASAGADVQEAAALPQVSTLKVLFRNRVLRIFVLPVNRQNPPAASVIEKLNAIDPAHEWLGIVRIVTRFICAPDMRDLAELFDPTRDFLFIESGRREIRFDPGNVAIDIQNLRPKVAAIGHLSLVPRHCFCGRDQSRARNEK